MTYSFSFGFQTLEQYILKLVLHTHMHVYIHTYIGFLLSTSLKDSVVGIFRIELDTKEYHDLKFTFSNINYFEKYNNFF
jgi:hypothetical protein